MRPDLEAQKNAEQLAERDRCQQRRERVLRYPDIAQRLCEKPLALASPEFWSGYIPPKVHQEVINPSPIRRQLIAICQAVVEREENERAPVAPPMVDEKGLQLLHICFNEAKITEREDKLLYAISVINRPIESSKDLTAEEAYLIRKSLTALVNSEAQSEAQSEPVSAQGREPVNQPQADSQAQVNQWKEEVRRDLEEPPY